MEALASEFALAGRFSAVVVNAKGQDETRSAVSILRQTQVTQVEIFPPVSDQSLVFLFGGPEQDHLTLRTDRPRTIGEQVSGADATVWSVFVVAMSATD